MTHGIILIMDCIQQMEESIWRENEKDGWITMDCILQYNEGE